MIPPTRGMAKHLTLQQVVDAIWSERKIKVWYPEGNTWIEGRCISWFPPNKESRGDFRVMIRVSLPSPRGDGSLWDSNWEVYSRNLQWASSGPKLGRGKRKMAI